MLWFVVFLAVVGYIIYYFDKKLKKKFDDKFNPTDWDLPSSVSAAIPEATQTVQVAQQAIGVGYETKPSLLSPAEQAFFGILQAALRADYVIFAKVGLDEVIHIKAGQDKLAMQRAFNKLSGQRFDFVICARHGLAILAVIKLHQSQQHHSVAQENYSADVCQSAGLKLLEFNEQSAYIVGDVRHSILSALGVVEKVEMPSSESALDIKDIEKADEPINLKLCPKCSAVMVKRTAKTGEHEGKVFWACSTYPKCRGLIPL